MSPSSARYSAIKIISKRSYAAGASRWRSERIYIFAMMLGVENVASVCLAQPGKFKRPCGLLRPHATPPARPHPSFSACARIMSSTPKLFPLTVTAVLPLSLIKYYSIIFSFNNSRPLLFLETLRRDVGAAAISSALPPKMGSRWCSKFKGAPPPKPSPHTEIESTLIAASWELQPPTNTSA